MQSSSTTTDNQSINQSIFGSGTDEIVGTLLEFTKLDHQSNSKFKI
jgi:hypothetical protein